MSSLGESLNYGARTQAAREIFAEKLRGLSGAASSDLKRRLGALNDADWGAIGNIWAEFGDPAGWFEDAENALQQKEARLIRDTKAPWSWGLRLRALRELRDDGIAFHGRAVEEPFHDPQGYQAWTRQMTARTYSIGRY